jgi:hypothetical protein
MSHTKAENGEVPIWAVAIAENSDFWADLQIDDYTHPVFASKATLQLRKIFYAILGRMTPMEEQQAVGELIVEIEVAPEADFPGFERLQTMKRSKKEKALTATFQNVVHANFKKTGSKRTTRSINCRSRF